MKKESKFSLLIELLLTFIKVGALTFGGGYAMIPIIHREVVEKKKWISNDDIIDIIAIAESTPGPIAINAATFVGYKMAGFWGALFATIGISIPSFLTICLVSIFYEIFIQNSVIQSIFKGLSVGVICLLFLAFFKIKKTMTMSKETWIAFGVILALLIVKMIFPFDIPFFTLILIVCGFIFGIVLEAIKGRKIK